MKLIRADIISLFRSAYAEPRESFINNNDVMIYFWQALSGFYNEVDPEWATSEATFATTKNAIEYPIGFDSRKIKAVFAMRDNDSTKWIRLGPIEYTEFLRRFKSRTTTSDRFTHYYVIRNHIGLYPAPDSSSLNSDLTGALTLYSEDGYGTYTFTGAALSMTADAYVGKKLDVSDGTNIETFTILSNTDTEIVVDHQPSYNDMMGNEVGVLTSITFEIWSRLENIRVVYSERPQIPNEDTERNLGSVTDVETSTDFQYDIPEEYLDTLMSYMLYLACRKDKLLNDAASHKADWREGLANAKRNTGKVKDDFYNDFKTKNRFHYPASPSYSNRVVYNDDGINEGGTNQDGS